MFFLPSSFRFCPPLKNDGTSELRFSTVLTDFLHIGKNKNKENRTLKFLFPFLFSLLSSWKPVLPEKTMLHFLCFFIAFTGYPSFMIKNNTRLHRKYLIYIDIRRIMIVQ